MNTGQSLILLGLFEIKLWTQTKDAINQGSDYLLFVEKP